MMFVMRRPKTFEPVQLGLSPQSKRVSEQANDVVRQNKIKKKEEKRKEKKEDLKQLKNK